MKRRAFTGLKGERISRQTANRKIEQLIRRKDKKGQSYSAAELQFLSQYSGDGGIGRANAKGKGVLYEYYTPGWLCQKIWELARHHGFTTGGVLDPAIGTGNFLLHAPDPKQVTGFEINPVSARIAKLSFPGANIHQQPFETALLRPPKHDKLLNTPPTWLKGYPFDLVIGNPPFGQWKSKYKAHLLTPRFYRMESFFIYHSLQLLRPGGLLLFLVLSQLFRNGQKYNATKALIGSTAELLDLYRLPRIWAEAKINVDLLILRKK